jgi:hypothetical protein
MNIDDDKPLEGQVVVHDGQVPPMALALADAEDAGMILDRAVKQADRIMDVIRKKNLAVRIGGRDGREYVRIEAWTALATMNGKRFDVLATQNTGSPDDEDFKASACVGLRDIRSGEIVMRAWGSCARKEKNWASRDTFAIESMAQTRAAGKVARLAYGWIVAMAGFEGTPAEEITTVEAKGGDPIADDVLAVITETGKAKKQDKVATMKWLFDRKYVGWDDFIKRGNDDAIAFMEYLNGLPSVEEAKEEKKK